MIPIPVSQNNFIHSTHWPAYDRLYGWLHHFGLLKKQTPSSDTQNKRWRGLWVDNEMKDSWLERLNNIPCIAIVMTCAGHSSRKDHFDRPHFSFTPFCDPRADLLATMPEKIELFMEIEHRLGGQKFNMERFSNIGFSWYKPEEVSFDTHLFWIHSQNPRKDMTKKEFNGWWENAIASLEEFGAQEVERWGPDPKGTVPPEAPTAPFFGSWYISRPDNYILDKGYVGPFDNIDDAYVAADEAARNAGAKKVTSNWSKYEAYKEEAIRTGSLAEFIDGFLNVEDLYGRRIRDLKYHEQGRLYKEFLGEDAGQFPQKSGGSSYTQ